MPYLDFAVSPASSASIFRFPKYAIVRDDLCRHTLDRQPNAMFAVATKNRATHEPPR